MTITSRPLTNGASWPRELKPTVLLCAHITANTASAADQVHYANRAGSGGPSAHDYLDPDGSGLEALVPAQRCAWSNGDVQSPNLSIPTVKAAVLAGVNPNRIVWREVECVGDASHPVTDAQLEQLARFVAADARATGLPIDRSTVTTHADWNSVTRRSCAFPPAVREARMARLIARAQEIAEGGTPMISKVARQRWTAANGSGVLRAQPDRASAPVVRLPDGAVVTSVAELQTPDGNNWRATEWPAGSGTPAYLLRSGPGVPADHDFTAGGFVTGDYGDGWDACREAVTKALEAIP